MATCARRYSNMCEATWQHVRGDMATCTRRYGNMCEAIWQHVRGDMATCDIAKCAKRYSNSDDTPRHYWLDPTVFVPALGYFLRLIRYISFNDPQIRH
ncbi:hypothetical protein J6590_096925 [Homalodisca vitripennis]|nr:hypothetical protein J6590_096925 [Homalodisca vitripennis]